MIVAVLQLVILNINYGGESDVKLDIIEKFQNQLEFTSNQDNKLKDFVLKFLL